MTLHDVMKQRAIAERYAPHGGRCLSAGVAELEWYELNTNSYPSQDVCCEWRPSVFLNEYADLRVHEVGWRDAENWKLMQRLR